MPEDVVELDTIKLLLETANFFVVGRHFVIAACCVLHGLVNDEPRVASHVEAPCP
jgi:hypothetical protein